MYIELYEPDHAFFDRFGDSNIRFCETKSIRKSIDIYSQKHENKCQPLLASQ